jgi:hypothetical protein
VLERRLRDTDWVERFGPVPIAGSVLEFDDPDVVPGSEYAYRLTVHGNDVITTPEIWVSVPASEVPTVPTLGLPLPNPSSSGVTFTAGIPNSGAVLHILDVRGRTVRQLPVGRQGSREVRWDGRDEVGRAVASGIYFVTLRGVGVEVIRRVVLLR